MLARKNDQPPSGRPPRAARTSLDQHFPLLVLITPASTPASTPRRFPSCMASATASMLAPSTKLLHSFAAQPAPGPPTCTMLRPIAPSSGFAAAKAGAEPPTLNVCVPASAPPTPPLTGASTNARPRAAAEPPTDAATPGLIVEQSSSSVPGRAPPKIPRAPPSS